ncbi:flagellar basal body-associated FliL family protein [Conexibacter sp. DBS9H8]|uniref:flagellar basal body-associated FliL family protein n=1 Tax=Conexibacter sp. DBS9H8 TaxID=2937801 RepID=UPI00200CD9A4|nr:flagellar basal body-associated FliL family protein [Conexibacter sp. DBS9H8]
MKKKLLILLPVLLLAVGGVGAYAFVLPHKPAPPLKLVGNVVALPGQFTLNLAGGHYATLSVALLLPATVKGGPADEPVISSIVTNDVTGQPMAALISARGRSILEHRIMENINGETNAVVTRVYFTNLAVQ